MIGKLIITKEVQNIIDVLHKQIGSTEWSGSLFYKLTKGNIRDFKDLEFTVIGIYPMNIGSSIYTEFEYNSDFIVAHNIFKDSLECSTGLVHSHHSMKAFFSPTDDSELRENAGNYNYYISLIVAFDRNYVAKIAFPSKTKTVVKYCIKNDKGVLETIEQEKESNELVIEELVVELPDKLVKIEWLNDRINKLKEDSKAKLIVDNDTKMYRGLHSLIPEHPYKEDIVFSNNSIKSIPSGEHTINFDNKSIELLDELTRLATNLPLEQVISMTVKEEPITSDVLSSLYDSFETAYVKVYGLDVNSDKHSAEAIVKLYSLTNKGKNYIVSSLFEVLIEQLM